MELSLTTWADIPGYEGLYIINSLGEIHGLDRVTTVNNTTSRRIPGRMLRAGVAKNGYELCWLSDCMQQSHCHYIHDLVCAAFMGPKPAGYVVCHYDGDKTNNKLENLRYDTQAGNIQDSYRLGEIHSKMTKEKVLMLRALRAQGLTLRQLGEHFGIHPSQAGHIVNRKYWGWVA